MSDKMELSRSLRFYKVVIFPKEEVLLQKVQNTSIILNQPVKFLKILCLICSDSTFLLSVSQILNVLLI